MLNRHMAALRESLALEMLSFAASDAREGFAALSVKRAPLFGSE